MRFAQHRLQNRGVKSSESREGKKESRAHRIKAGSSSRYSKQLVCFQKRISPHLALTKDLFIVVEKKEAS